MFGKTLQQKRNYRTAYLIENLDQHKKQVRKPEFRGFTIFEEDLVQVESVQRVVKLDRPLSIGFIVLERAKFVMFEFFYKGLVPTFPQLQLLLTDTDSFLIHVESDDINRDLRLISHFLDFSKYPTTHPLYSTRNAGVPGKFKSETNGKVIAEFIGLRSKCYSILLADSSTKSAAAGPTRDVARRCLTHDIYRKTLQQVRDFNVQQVTMRSKNHHMLMLNSNKISLSAYDDKRWIEDDGVHSKAFGHYSLDK